MFYPIFIADTNIALNRLGSSQHNDYNSQLVPNSDSAPAAL